MTVAEKTLKTGSNKNQKQVAKAKKKPVKRDVRAEVVAKIAERLKTIDAGGFRMPWVDGVKVPRRITGEEYKGTNMINLWLEAGFSGFGCSTWMTYRQAKELGGQVRKGEKGTTVIKYGTFEKKEDAGSEQKDNNDNVLCVLRFARGYTVFNAAQIDGLPEKYYDFTEVEQEDRPRPEVQAWIDRQGANIKTGGDTAAFLPLTDEIILPPIAQFHRYSGYYATAAHELAHWTGHKSRLNREKLKTKIPRGAYAFEELVAELSAAMVGAHFGFADEHIDNHSHYLKSWISLIEEEKDIFFRAVREANEAVDFLFGRNTTKM